MPLKVSTLKSYISNNLNILISGPAGTGKTTMLREAAAELGLKMAYYNAARMDPYIEFRGLPVPNQKTEKLEFWRQGSFEEAEVIFFDEINRADSRVLDQIFDLVQFREINGVRLENLKAVVSGINPVDDGGYLVNELDTALVDRFDVYLYAEPTIDKVYFKTKFNENVANVVSDWWNEQYTNYLAVKRNSKNSAVYLSPRRMEKMVAAYKLIPSITTLEDTLPPGAEVNLKPLAQQLKRAFAESDTMVELEGIDRYLEFTAANYRNMSKADIEEFTKVVINDSETTNSTVRNRLIQSAALALSVPHMDKNFIIDNWVPVFAELRLEMYNKIVNEDNGWSSDDVAKLYTKISEYNKV